MPESQLPPEPEVPRAVFMLDVLPSMLAENGFENEDAAASWAAEQSAAYDRMITEELDLSKPYEAATVIKARLGEIVRTHPRGIHSNVSDYLRLLASYAFGTALGKELAMAAGPTGSPHLGPALVDRSG